MARDTNYVALIKARRAVAEILDLVPAATDGCDEDRFWEILAEEAAARIGKVLAEDGPGGRPMSEPEAVAFEHSLVPPGYRYAGTEVGLVPVDYWVALTESEFRKQLIRYLRSRHFRRQQGLGG